MQVLAYLWDVLCRDKVKDDDLEQAVDERLNEHNMVYYLKKRLPNPLRPRELVRSSPTLTLPGPRRLQPLTSASLMLSLARSDHALRVAAAGL